MNSQCQPDNKTRYNHQEKCRRLKELFFAENLSSQGTGGITVDKNENIVNKTNYYFSKQAFPNNNDALAKETPVKVKAHIVGLPQPQIVQKVSFSHHKCKENYIGKMHEAYAGDSQKKSPVPVNPITSTPKSYLRSKMLFDDVKNMNHIKDSESPFSKANLAGQDTNTFSDVGNFSHSKYESSFMKAKRFAKANETANMCNVSDAVNRNHSKGELPFVRAKVGLAPLAVGEDTNSCIDGAHCDHSKSDKCFDVKMLKSFSVCSDQKEKNHCVPTFPRSYLNSGSIKTTHLIQKRDRTSSGHLALESDFLIDDEIADQPSLITFEKNRAGAKTYAGHQERAKEAKSDGISGKCSNERRPSFDQPNQTSDSYYYIYNQLVPDVRSIKSSVLHLKRVLCQNTLYHQLAEADQPLSQENYGSEKHLEEFADMRRQVVFLEEQLREKERVISNLQRQMSGMADLSKGKETCSKATQT